MKTITVIDRDGEIAIEADDNVSNSEAMGMLHIAAKLCFKHLMEHGSVLTPREEDATEKTKNEDDASIPEYINTHEADNVTMDEPFPAYEVHDDTGPINERSLAEEVDNIATSDVAPKKAYEPIAEALENVGVSLNDDPEPVPEPVEEPNDDPCVEPTEEVDLNG